MLFEEVYNRTLLVATCNVLRLPIHTLTSVTCICDLHLWSRGLESLPFPPYHIYSRIFQSKNPSNYASPIRSVPWINVLIGPVRSVI